MFGFFKRRKPYYGDSVSSAKKEQDELLPSLHFHEKLDFQVFRHNDVVVKIKLPEPARLLLEELDSKRHIGRSQLARELLFSYVYGWYALELMYQEKEGFYWDSRVRFSRRDDIEKPEAQQMPYNLAPELGKNTYDLTVWLPNDLFLEIESLATQAKISTSHFCREIIAGALMGRSVLSERLLATNNNRGIS